MNVQDPPHIILLRAIDADLNALDLEQATGTGGWTIKHSRNEAPPALNKPSLTIVWLGNSDIPDAPYKNDFERQKTMAVQLVFDMDLPSDDSDLDPIGWTAPSAAAAAAVNALRDPASQTMQRTDWVQEGDTTPDDSNSGPDNARLVQDLTVLYRVLTDDPSTLLWQEDNGG